MNPGELDTFVTIRRATETRAANGSVIKTWADIGNIWMSTPKPVSGREAVTAQQLQIIASSKSVIRHGSGVTAKDRIVDGSTTYEITRIAPTGTRNSWQELWLTEAKP